MNKMISFDLETLGSHMESPITQLGAVKFDLENIYTDDAFVMNVTHKSLEYYKFKVGYSSVYWWTTETNDEVRKFVFDQESAENIRLVFLKFVEWIEKPSEYQLWSHRFDVPVLKNAFDRVDIKEVPIPHMCFMDIITLCNLVKMYLDPDSELPKTDRKGLHHYALDDAIYQAEYIQKFLKVLLQV